MAAQSNNSSRPLQLFYSFAHEDEAMLERLQKHLTPLVRTGMIRAWDSREVVAGTDWTQEVNQQINTADIILVLLSSDFLASDYAYSIEMQRALERHERGEARVIPIILRPVIWEDSPFARLQVLPTDGEPVTSIGDIDEGFFYVVRDIRRICEEMQNRLSSPPKDFAMRAGVRPSVSLDLSKVFVKSGLPEITFVAPEDFVFLKLALEPTGRGVVIEGPSGVGKTTAVKKAIEELKAQQSEIDTRMPVQHELSARNPADCELLRTIREWHGGTVIIDDFHRLDPALRQELVNYLKELADRAPATEAKKLVIVGIPRTNQSLVSMSMDLATRLDVFNLTTVKNELIQQMIEKGEEALNIKFDRKADIVLKANGSLNLAQFICFNLCAMSNITQTQEQTQVVQCDIDAAMKRVMRVLEMKFEEPLKHFIALGGPTDVTCLRLLEALATSKDGFLSLPILKGNKPDLAQGIERFCQECWMDNLYHACSDCASLLYFDQLRQALVIDDPQLSFYLKNIRFSILARQAGKVSTLAQRRVFISYSHLDADWLRRLRLQIKPLERDGIVDLWDDTRITAGIQWRDAIAEALETARVAVLLVSAAFLASDFIAEHELPTLLTQAQMGGTTIIPVILSPSLYSTMKLGAFQSINPVNKPLSGMAYTEQEDVLVQVAQMIQDQFKAG